MYKDHNYFIDSSLSFFTPLFHSLYPQTSLTHLSLSSQLLFVTSEGTYNKEFLIFSHYKPTSVSVW